MKRRGFLQRLLGGALAAPAIAKAVSDTPEVAQKTITIGRVADPATVRSVVFDDYLYATAFSAPIGAYVRFDDTRFENEGGDE